MGWAGEWAVISAPVQVRADLTVILELKLVLEQDSELLYFNIKPCVRVFTLVSPTFNSILGFILGLYTVIQRGIQYVVLRCQGVILLDTMLPRLVSGTDRIVFV